MPISMRLRGDHVTLVQAVKLTGTTQSGGEAKVRIREGEVRVNGEAETRPGRKLHVGDRFTIGDGEWVIES